MATRYARPIELNNISRIGDSQTQLRKAAARRGRGIVNGGRPRHPVLPVRINADFTTAFGKSPAEAERLTRDLLTADRPGKERLADSGELLHWVSASGNAQHRRTLIAGFRKAGAELALIHHLALLPREQTTVFMKEYFDNGGSLEPVVHWLGLAGAVKRITRRSRTSRSRVAARWSPPRRPATRNARGLFDWVENVWEGVKNAGKAAVDAVESVVDSVVKAGKSMADAIGAAVSWSMEKVTDLVEALLGAGKKVADILAAAAAKSIEQLKKYVEAVLAAGRSIAEILIWAAGEAAARVNAVVAKLLQLGRDVLEMLKVMIAPGRMPLVAIVKALVAAGKKLYDIVVAIGNEAAAVLKPVLDALLAAGHTLRNVLVEAAKLTASACRTIIDVLMDLGKSLTDLLREAAAAAGATLRVVIQALLALAHTVTKVLVAAAALTAAAIKSVVQVLLALGHALVDLVRAVAGQAFNVVRAVFAAILAVGRPVAQILKALAGRAVSALRTALEALLAIGVSLAELVKDLVTGVAEAFRRGFFEGLVALGKAPLQLLKAAAEIGVSVLLLAFSVVLEMCGGYRELTKEERAEAKKVFGSAIRLERVKLGFASLPGEVIRYVNVELPRAFTTMYLLNFGPGAKIDMQTIIHELAHVWQGVQEGPLYMTRALEAQIGAGVESLFHSGKYDDSEAYWVTEDDLLAHRGDLTRFNPEQQASIIEFFWMRAFSAWAVPNGFPADAHGVTVPPLEALLPYMRSVNADVRVAGTMAPAKKRLPRAQQHPATATESMAAVA